MHRLASHLWSLESRWNTLRRGIANRKRTTQRRTGNEPPAFPLDTAMKRRISTVLEPAAAARLVVARRAKPSPVPDHVRLVLTLELRRELAEELSLKAIKSERNIEAIVIALIEEAGTRIARAASEEMASIPISSRVT